MRLEHLIALQDTGEEENNAIRREASCIRVIDFFRR